VGREIIGTLALPIDTMTLFANRDNLISTRIIERLSWVPGLFEKEVYLTLHRVAINAGGYVMGKDAFALSYDWRRDLVESARQLGILIENIRRQTGQPDIKVNLICHSAGGLIARYFVRYGTAGAYICRSTLH
jgi:hypothetical protein